MSRQRIILHIDRINAPEPISREALRVAIQQELGARLSSSNTALAPDSSSHAVLSADPVDAHSRPVGTEGALGHAVANAAMGILKR